MKHIRFKKLRLWLVYPAFLIYPVVARMTDFSFVAGAGLILIGMAVRFWASGYIRKSRELATAGPYAHTRNPLYVGNFIIGLGVCVISANMWLVLYYAIAFSFVYLGTIKEEEEVLAEKFGPSYTAYLRHVPRFLPSIVAYHSGQKMEPTRAKARGSPPVGGQALGPQKLDAQATIKEVPQFQTRDGHNHTRLKRRGVRPQGIKFDIRLSFKNGEFIRLCGFSLLVLFFDLWRRLFVKKETLGVGGWGVVFLFVVFLGLLWFNIAIRRKSERSERSEARI